MFYQIENDEIKAIISDLGATLVSLIDKKNDKDLIVGYKTEEDYIKYKNLYAGATVGRCANVIKEAKFKLNDKEYLLSENISGKHLHGGFEGFSFVKWDFVDKKNNEITFHYFSKDGEEGYPGNLNVEVTYKLDSLDLIFSYAGISDADTLFNMTNHTYFNFGNNDLKDVYLRIKSNEYVSKGIHERKNVNGDLRDFRKFKNVYETIIELNGGLDNDFLYESLEYKLMAEVRNSEYLLSIYSDLPNIQIYTANDFIGQKGKYNAIYNKYTAIALEPQYQPNSINYQGYIKPILKANEKKLHSIKYAINRLYK